MKCRLSILESMDEKLKMIAAFNVQLKEFDSIMNELAAWLGVGRKRMDDLVTLFILKYSNNLIIDLAQVC